MKTLIAFSLLMAFASSSATYADPTVRVVPSEEFKRRNTFVRDGRGTGTRGGGDYRLKDIIDLRAGFYAARSRLILALSSVDWAKHSDPETRRLFVETILPMDPVRVLEELEIHVGERCRSDRGKASVLIASDAPWVCVDLRLSEADHASAWLRIAEQKLGLPTSVAEALPRVDSVLESGIRLDRTFRLSIPALALPETVRCTLDLTGVDRAKLEVRRHPRGLWLVKLNETYGLCE